MASTTLKLPEEMKARVSALADSAGVSPHAWMVEALAEKVDYAEKRAAFVRSALIAAEEVERYGETLDADEVHRYLRDKIAGKASARPTPKKR